MRDGVEDYELLKVLASRDPERAATLAQEVVASFTDYMRDVAAFRQVRQALLDALD